MTASGSPETSPPSWLRLLSESRVLLEAALGLLSGPWLAKQDLRGIPVLVVPGLCASDLSTWPLRRHLRACGAVVAGWGQGLNRGPRPGVMAHLEARLQTLHAAHGRPVALVGWSLGGLLCRNLAARRPALAGEVIALGSPLSGEPGATRLGPLFQWVSGGIPESVAQALFVQAQDTPVTSIFSRRDGIVAWQASATRDRRVRALEVRGSHLGMCWNPEVMQRVAARIAACAKSRG